jgi:N6-L-threonylcarbamoyladenine synthase
MNLNENYILAIESSCDDTSAAVLHNGKVLANIIASQKIHEQWGGVVPELASRAHAQHIVPVVDSALQQAGITAHQLHAVAYTQGPGLIGSLLVGSSFAKGLALTLNIPLITVHHMQAHVLAHFIDEPKPQFPFLCLTVSGGHTQIVLVEDFLKMKIVGETIDDAAGEAFDKAAKIFGLPYPGGPLIDKYAQAGDATKFQFAEPDMPELNFSFSGFKTSVLYAVQKELKQNEHFVAENLNDLCAAVQQRIINILMKKLKKASKQFGIKEIAIAGGVSANTGLRKALETIGQQEGWNVYIPQFQYCTDNAAMIGITAYYKFLQQDFSNLSDTPQPRIEF